MHDSVGQMQFLQFSQTRGKSLNNDHTDLQKYWSQKPLELHA